MVSGAEVKHVLREVGITQRRCAQLCKIPEQYISEYIANKREMDSDKLIRLSDFIDKVKRIMQ